MERIVNVADGAPVVGPYSLAVNHCHHIETAGQIALTPEGGLIQDTIQEETHQVMRNLAAILGESGCTFANVTSAQIYYTEKESFNEINDVYAQYFPEGHYPARTTVGQSFLPLGARVEISMRACINV